MPRPTALPTILALAALLAAGCVVPGAGAPKARLAVSAVGDLSVNLRAEVSAPRGVLAFNQGSNRLTRADVDHVVFHLSVWNGSTESAAIATVDVPEGRLDLGVTFSRLKANTSYRVRAAAYRAPGTAAGDRIGDPAADFLAFSTGINDTPFIFQPIPIVLDDVAPKFVTLWAGGGPAGQTDALGTAARFLTPHGICIDGDENVYVADHNNHRIRKITPDGDVTVLAGLSQGYADDTGASAQFDRPVGVAADGAGNVYVTEAGNYTVRKITPGGVVTTVAGDYLDNADHLDGNGASARFVAPYGIAAKADGTLYVTDRHVVRAISPSGDVVTIAGDGTAGADDGPGASARFNSARGIAIAANGDLIVADTSNHRIRRIDMSGPLHVVTTIAGSGGQGANDAVANNATFNYPGALAIADDGSVFIADTNSNKIRRLSRNGRVRTFAGSGGNGIQEGELSQASFDAPQGIAIGPDGTIYVCDVLGNSVRRIL